MAEVAIPQHKKVALENEQGQEIQESKIAGKGDKEVYGTGDNAPSSVADSKGPPNY